MRDFVLYVAGIPKAVTSAPPPDPASYNSYIESTYSTFELHGTFVLDVDIVAENMRQLFIFVIPEHHLNWDAAWNSRIVSEEGLHLLTIACQYEDNPPCQIFDFCKEII
jgi:hypothetical protein